MAALEEERARLLAELGAEDAAARPDLKDLLLGFIEKGKGRPEVAVEALSSGFRGRAGMVQLLTEWLDTAEGAEGAEGGAEGGGGGTPKAPPQGRRGSAAGAGGSAAAARSAFEAAASGASDGAAGAAGAPAHGALGALLSELVVQRFDAAAADRLEGGAPPWLGGLVADEHSRRMLYTLSDEHERCLLLEMAITAAWGRAAATDEERGACAHELAHVAATSELFPVLSGVLVDRLAAAAGGKGSATAMADFMAAACHSEVTYCYAQMLLAGAASGDGCGEAAVVAEALAARLKEEAVARHGDRTVLLSPLLGSAEQRLAAVMLAKIAARGEPPARRQAEELLRVLEAETAEALPLLRVRRVRALLLTPLFAYGERSTEAHRETLLKVLAIGAGERESAGESSGTAAAIVAMLAALDAADSASANVKDAPWEALCLIEAAAEGALIRCEGAFGSIDFYLGVSHRRAMPRLLKACVAAATRHPLLRAAALRAVMTAVRLRREGDGGDDDGESERVVDIEVALRSKTQALDAAVELAALGHAGAVMRAVKEWAHRPGEGADPSLQRHFASRMLAAAAPPYAAAFVRATLSLAAEAGLASHAAVLRAFPNAAEGLASLLEAAEALPGDDLDETQREACRALRSTHATLCAS